MMFWLGGAIVTLVGAVVSAKLIEQPIRPAHILAAVVVWPFTLMQGWARVHTPTGAIGARHMIEDVAQQAATNKLPPIELPPMPPQCAMKEALVLEHIKQISEAVADHMKASDCAACAATDEWMRKHTRNYSL
jgi:hypothetical protein